MSEYPSLPARTSIWSVLVVVLICAAVAFIAYELGRQAHGGKARRLWTPIVVTPTGAETALEAGTRRLEFWTPSGKTKDYLARDRGTIPDRDQWEIISSDEPVQQFGALLRTNSSVLGYRRAEVWGHGRTTLKPGWWWTMTVMTNYSVQTFIHAYRNFWKSSNAVFVEVIENTGEE